MTTKAATANGLDTRETEKLATVDRYLSEMSLIRKRMKPLDARIRRADAAIRRSLDETRSVLRNVQATR